MHQVCFQLLDEGTLVDLLRLSFLKLLLQAVYVTLLLGGAVLHLCQLCVQLSVTLLQPHR